MRSLLAALVGLLTQASSSSSSSSGSVCEPPEGEAVLLRERERLLFRPGGVGLLTVGSEPCGLLHRVNVSDVLRGGDAGLFRDASGGRWFEVAYGVEGPLLTLEFRGANGTSEALWRSEDLPSCDLGEGLQFRFFGMSFCPDGRPQEASSSGGGAPGHSLVGLRGGAHGGHHVVFVPVGAILFLVSVCCKCWYRRKRHVRAVAVVRRASASEDDAADGRRRPRDAVDVDVVDDDDVDVVEDLPPAYADIQDETAPPPPYSEVEKLSPAAALPPPPPPPPAPPAGAEAEDPREEETRKLSSRAKGLAQFSFRPLREEE